MMSVKNKIFNLLVMQEKHNEEGDLLKQDIALLQQAVTYIGLR